MMRQTEPHPKGETIRDREEVDARLRLNLSKCLGRENCFVGLSATI